MTELRTGTVHLLTVQIVCPYCQNAPEMRLHGTPNVFTARQYVEHTQAGRAFCTECGQDFSLPANPWTERDALRAALAPFRLLAAAIPSGHADEARLIVTTADWKAGVNDMVGYLTVGDVRRARAAWAGRDGGGTDE